MQDRFFVDLKEASERGEVKLEYDKFEYEQYLANGGDEEAAEMEEEDVELEDYDFNHYEGLGNGYNRTLFSGDYLLGPSRVKNGELSIKKSVLEPTEELPEEAKYNLLQSLGNDLKVEAEKSSPYTLIQEVTVSSSKAQYKQESKPTQGTLPSLRQEWVEFVFRGKAMAEKENMFTVTLPPIQTSVTVTTRLNSTSQTNYQTTMLVNKEKANPSPSMTIEGSSDPTQYEIRLLEGNNYLEFTCEDLDTTKTEVLRLWIVVLP